MGNKKFVLKSDISKSELESLARCFLPSIQAFFETEEARKNTKNGKPSKRK